MSRLTTARARSPLGAITTSPAGLWGIWGSRRGARGRGGGGPRRGGRRDGQPPHDAQVPLEIGVVPPRRNQRYRRGLSGLERLPGNPPVAVDPARVAGEVGPSPAARGADDGDVPPPGRGPHELGAQ